MQLREDYTIPAPPPLPLPPAIANSATCEGWQLTYSRSYPADWKYEIRKPDGSFHREGELVGDRDQLFRDFRLIVTMNTWILAKPKGQNELIEQMLKDATALLPHDEEPPASFQSAAAHLGKKLDKNKSRWRVTKA